MAKFVKQPAKIGDKVYLFGGVKPFGITEYKAYRVVATQNSKVENRKSFGHVYPLGNHTQWNKDRFGVFIIDDFGDKRFLRLGVDCFGTIVEKLCEQDKAKELS